VHDINDQFHPTTNSKIKTSTRSTRKKMNSFVHMLCSTFYPQ